MSQAKTVHYVDAVFGGRNLRFELRRDQVTTDRLEEVVGSVFACWVRFRDKTWTMRDLRTVLALAHPGPRGPFDRLVIPENVLADADRAAGRSLERSKEPRGVDLSVINAVLDRHPHITYVPLAFAILSAALIGLAEEHATFEEPALAESTA